MPKTKTLPTPLTIVKQLLKDVPPLTPLREAAQFLRMDERTVRRWIDQGRMTVLRTRRKRGGRILVPKSELERLLITMT